jgi:hypothetical protein
VLEKYGIPPLVNPALAGNVLLFTALALDAVQEVQVPVRLVITPLAGVPSAGVVKDGDTSGANPEIDAPLGIETVPVKVGDANGA